MKHRQDSSEKQSISAFYETPRKAEGKLSRKPALRAKVRTGREVRLKGFQQGAETGKPLPRKGPSEGKGI